MSLTPSQCKSLIAEKAIKLGISKIGFAIAQPIDDDAARHYKQWIERKNHGKMQYLERYDDVRCDPRLLLEGARSIIVCAINYYPRQHQNNNAPQIASYALGRDYHEVVRERLSLLAQYIKENFGGETRVCVDTAPIRERYWAVQAGVGFMGTNNQLILPGRGSYFFLGEILSTFDIEPDEPCRESCLGCGRCIKECPAGAISAQGYVDASRCLSYLTIEHRGELPEGTNLGNRIYGCDMCQTVCPHNRNAQPTTIDDFTPSEAILNLDFETIKTMTPQEFSTLFKHSAIKRTRLAGLQRNLKACTAGNKDN